MTGPLNGIRILELEGIGPGPFAAMMLADHGAEVIRIVRKGASLRSGTNPAADVLARSRLRIEVDLKSPDGVAVVKRLAGQSDGLIEGFRPGVAERLGIGPDVLLAVNPRLVYGRMTGWGQTGPYSPFAGHDINYIALAGALHPLGRAGEKPTPAVNLIGDFGGGGMMLAFGMVSALLHARATGQGQVIDCAMTEGAAVLSSMIWGFRAGGNWPGERGTNLLDTGAHFYDTYETADGKFVAIGAIEPQFYALLRERVGLAGDPDFDPQLDRSAWPALKNKIAAVFATKTRDEWCAMLEHTDACFAPVLAMDEAPTHPHNVARQSFLDVGGTVQPAPAPRYSLTATSPPRAACAETDTERVLAMIGYEDAQIADLKSAGVIA